MRTALLLVALASCASFQPVTRTVRARDVAAPERTRLTSRFTWDAVGSKEPEHAPPGTSVEAVTDIATLGVIGDRTCVQFTMRTGAKHDAPFGEWAVTINGEPVFPEHETSRQHVVEVAGERTVVDAAFIGKGTAGALTVTEPTTDEYAIVERAAWFCPSGPIASGAGQLSFQLTRDFRGQKMRQGFVWTIVR